ncbi:MAG: hypothetical protein V4530_06155 [Pseudomonadota bacterium]
MTAADPPRRQRRWDQGDIRPYRPLPADFREVFLRLGNSIEIRDHYRTNWRVIRRWIDEAGGEELRAERRAVTGATARPALRSKNRASRYVLGRTLTALSGGKKKG